MIWNALFNPLDLNNVLITQGRLTRTEFKAIFAEIFPFGSSGEFADRIFSVFDRSKDNKITFMEYIQVIIFLFLNRYDNRVFANPMRLSSCLMGCVLSVVLANR